MKLVRWKLVPHAVAAVVTAVVVAATLVVAAVMAVADAMVAVVDTAVIVTAINVFKSFLILFVQGASIVFTRPSNTAV
jgi:hypothetical protein